MWITRLYTQRIPSRMTHCLKQLSEGKTSDAAAFNQRVIGQNIRLNTETQKKSRGPIWGFTETHFTSPPCNSYTAVIMLLWLEGAAFLHHNHKNWLKTSKKQNHIFCWRLFFCFFSFIAFFSYCLSKSGLLIFWPDEYTHSFKAADECFLELLLPLDGLQPVWHLTPDINKTFSSNSPGYCYLARCSTFWWPRWSKRFFTCVFTCSASKVQIS